MRVHALRHGQSEYNLLRLCNDDPTQSSSSPTRRRCACSRASPIGLPPEATIDLAFGNCEVYSFLL